MIKTSAVEYARTQKARAAAETATVERETFMVVPNYTLRMPASHTRVTFEFTPRCEGNALTCEKIGCNHSTYEIAFVVATCASVYDTVDYALTIAYNYLDNFDELCDLVDTHTVEATSIVKVTD